MISIVHPCADLKFFNRMIFVYIYPINGQWRMYSSTSGTTKLFVTPLKRVWIMYEFKIIYIICKQLSNNDALGRPKYLIIANLILAKQMLPIHFIIFNVINIMSFFASIEHWHEYVRYWNFLQTYQIWNGYLKLMGLNILHLSAHTYR